MKALLGVQCTSKSFGSVTLAGTRQVQARLRVGSPLLQASVEMFDLREEANMRTLLGVVVVVLLSPLHPAFAEGLTAGKYSGTATVVGAAGKPRTDQIEIKIDKVEGGTVQGTVTRFQGFCRGDVPVVGVLAGDKLTLQTDKAASGVKEGCGANFELKVNGEKLEGKSASGSTLVLSK